MKFAILLFFCLSTVYTCYPQFPVTDGSNSQILKWDSTDDIKSIGFYSIEQKRMIDYQYTVLRENKIIAEFFRHDDSTYFFIQYDSSGKHEIQSGLLRACTEVFKTYTLQIPDWNADPDGSKELVKDTVVADFSYRKSGLWKEKDSAGIEWRGNYVNGFKEGQWSAGYKYTNPHFPFTRADMYGLNFRTFFSYNYLHGKLKENYSNSTFWPTLKGSWVTDQIFYSEGEILTMTPFPKKRCDFDFINSFQVITYRNKYNEKDKKFQRIKSLAIWRQINDIIEIDDNVQKKKFKVLKSEPHKFIIQEILPDK